MPDKRKPKFFYGWIIVLASFFIMLVGFEAAGTYTIFFKPLIADFGWDRTATSGAYSLYAILHGFLGIGAGILCDRFGPRILMVACGFFLGLGCLLMSQISAIWQVYLFFGVIMALGASGFFIPLTTTIARWFVKGRGRIIGIVVSTGNGLGGVIWPFVVTGLIATIGWRDSYVVLGIIALAVVIPAGLFLRRDPSQMQQLPYGQGEVEEESANSKATGLSFREAIYTKQFWMMIIIYFCWGLALGTIAVHIVPHVTDVGITAAGAASILAVAAGGRVVGGVILGSVADKIGNRRTLLISFILLTVCLSLLLVATELWMFFVYAVIFGLAAAGLTVLEPVTAAELFGTRSLGVISGVIVAGFGIGGSIGPVLAGRIFDITQSYRIDFLITIALSVLGIILVALLRPAVGKEGEDDS